MSNFIYSCNVIVPIFLVVAAGYAFRRFGLVDGHFVKVATQLNYKVILPLLIFQNIYTSDLSSVFRPKLLLFTMACVVGSVVIFSLIFPLFIKDKRRCSAMIHTSYRSNVLLLGLPIFVNMFGEEHVGPLAMLYPFVIPAFNLLAVIILVLFAPDEGAEKQDGRGALLHSLKAIATNPLIIACVLGAALSLLGVDLPVILRKSVASFAQMATPMALLVIGGSFDFQKAWGNLRYSLTAVSIKLIVLPLVVVTLAVWCGFSGYELGAIFVIMASPTASSSFIMASAMDSDADLTAQATLISAFFSVFTVFGGVYLLKALALI